MDGVDTVNSRNSFALIKLTGEQAWWDVVNVFNRKVLNICRVKVYLFLFHHIHRSSPMSVFSFTQSLSPFLRGVTFFILAFA